MEEILDFEKNNVIFREGEEADALFIVQSGEVLCLKNSNERLMPIYKAKPGDIIGESALLADAPHIYSVIAVEKCVLVKIASNNFVNVLSEAPVWVQDLTRTMLSRYQNTSDLLVQNRVLHESILSEEDYPPTLENEYKRLIAINRE